MKSKLDMDTLPALLRIAASGSGPAPIVADWPGLLELARFHHVEPLVWRAVRIGEINAPAEVHSALERAYTRAMFREAQQDYVTAVLAKAFDEQKIPHVLLRGAVMKRDYSESALRTMSDLDYLVRLEGYSAIKQVVKTLGGQHVHTDGGHFSFLFPPQVMVEFHPNLIYTASPVGTAINPGWQYVRPGSGPYAQELTEEGFYLNMVCHLAYHFAKGGVGVRAVLDLWIYRHHHTPQPDQETVARELERAGLKRFADQVNALAEAWFGEGKMSPTLNKMSGYILTSGTHGVEKRAVLNAACFSARGTGASALVGRAFYPREELENRFPWAKGRVWLLPAAWLVRAARAVTRHPAHIIRWRKRAAGLSKQEIHAQQELLRRFGFQLGRK